MYSLVYKSVWNIELEKARTYKKPEGKQVVVRIHSTGICGTDLGIISGKYYAKPSVVLGHESAGEVIEIGDDVVNVNVGDRVVIDPTYYCGVCQMCRTNRQNHCLSKSHTESGVSSDGTFTPFYTTDERFLYKLSEGTDYDEASMTEPLSCVLTAIDKLNIRKEYKTLIIGAGPMGMLFSYALNAIGISGGIVEASKNRKELVQSIVSDNWKVFQHFDEAVEFIGNNNNQVDCIIDTSGTLPDDILSYITSGGVLALVSLKDSKISLNPREIADRSIRISGSIDSIGTFNSALHLIESGKIPVSKLITHVYRLEDYEEAFNKLGYDIENRQESSEKDAIKVVMRV